MYRILIVDDERRERAGLERLIRRYQYPLEIHQAADGEEALKTFEKMEIDILLTDIKMPFMTGIELIDQVHKRGYTPFCIIFSAYGEFEYAQNAISLGVIQYLLKPVLLEEFQKLFDHVCTLCEEKYKRLEENRNIQKEKRDKRMEESFRSFLLYLENEPFPQEDKEELRQIFLGKSYRILLMSSYSFLFSLHWKEYKEDIKKAAGEDTILISMEDTQALLLIPEKKGRNDEELRACCEKMIHVSKNTYQTDVFMVAGALCASLDEIKREYEKIKELMDYQFFASGSSCILYDRDYMNKKQSDMLPMYFSKIVTCAKLGDYAGLRSELEKAFQYIEKNMGFSSIYIKYNFTDIMKKVCECIGAEAQVISIAEKIYEAQSMETVKQVLMEFVEELEGTAEKGKTDNRLVAMAKKIVSERYGNVDFGVSSVAEELDVTPPYLSTLFKMETGKSLVKYITGYRMEQARVLLETSNMKVSDVAERVGYLNPSYFISLFRNKEGCSPQQYREKRFSHE